MVCPHLHPLCPEAEVPLVSTIRGEAWNWPQVCSSHPFTLILQRVVLGEQEDVFLNTEKPCNHLRFLQDLLFSVCVSGGPTGWEGLRFGENLCLAHKLRERVSTTHSKDMFDGCYQRLMC